MTDAEFAEVRAYAVKIATGGQLSGLSGAGNSSSYSTMNTDDFLFEFEAENRRRGGTALPQKVVQVLT